MCLPLGVAAPPKPRGLPMRRSHLMNGLAGATVLVIASAHFMPGSPRAGNVLAAAPVVARIPTVTELAGLGPSVGITDEEIEANVRTAVAALRKSVREMSHPQALD